MRLVTGPKLMRMTLKLSNTVTLKNQRRRDKFLLPPPTPAFEEVTDNQSALLTWLIAHGHLDIKIAYPSDTDANNPQAIYHEKMGVFFR